MKARVLIRPKDGVLDPQGEAVRRALGELGLPVNEARVGRLVELDLAEDEAAAAHAHVDRITGRLLANPLIESYEIELAPADA